MKRKPRTRKSASQGRSARHQQPLEQRLLITAVLCLLAFGALMVYSASSATTLLKGQGNGTLYLVRYSVNALIGLAVMGILMRVGPTRIRQLIPVALISAFVMLFAVLIPGIGVEVNGARRWLGVGPLQFQPSEVMKVVLVLYSAHLLASRPKCVRTLQTLVNPLLLVGAAAILLVSVADLGTGLVMAFALGALLIVGGAQLKHLALLSGTAIFLAGLFAVMEPYRRARLSAFLNPWADASTTGFQAVQGQIALGSGGLFGLGPGQSVQKVFYLPEAHTDFILAVVGEELGLIGIIGLLFLYSLIAFAGLRTAKKARDRYTKLVAAGLTSLIVLQAMLNIFTVLGLAPLTGVPLPFISYGSTNLIVLLGAMGLLIHIASGRNRIRMVKGKSTVKSKRVGAKHAAESRSRSGGNRRTRSASASGRRRTAR